MNKRTKIEISRCKRSFSHFCNYLKIVDKNGKLQTFKLNDAQQDIIDTLTTDKWLTILKARQLGSSTLIAAYFFWRTLFNVNERTIVVAHTHDSVKSIFNIYKTFYKHLPNFLRFKTEAASANELKFVTGSFVKVGSASSESFRGSTYQNIHASEVAFWKDIETTVASLFQTASDNSTIILETTANGLNDFQKLWLEDNGFYKLFVGWTKDRNYQLSKPPKKINDWIKTYSQVHNLTQTQMWWAAQTFDVKCAANAAIFNQEYPITPELAFLASGDRFFPKSYSVKPIVTGMRVYEAPEKYGIYSLGVDTASGSRTGDFSAFCLLKVVGGNKKAPKIVATYYDRKTPKAFAAIVAGVAKEYGALCCVESNSYGLSIIEHLVEQEVTLLYRRTKYDKIGNRWNEQLGFSTNVATRPLLLSRLQEYIAKGWLKPDDNRLQTEINTFIYDKTGKPIADSGKHDDLIFATGLAVMGLDQIDEVKQVKKMTKPANIPEMLEYEAKTGNLFAKVADKFHDPLQETVEEAGTVYSVLNKLT